MPDHVATTPPPRCSHCRRKAEQQIQHCPTGGLCAVCPNCGHHKSLTPTKTPPRDDTPTLWKGEPHAA
jgi:hypothetical protein